MKIKFCQVKQLLKKNYNHIQSLYLKNKKKLFVNYFGEVSADELFSHLKKHNVMASPYLFINIGYDKMLTYNGNISELIQLILKLKGNDGTILLPCLSTNMFYTPPHDFNVKTTPTYVGMIQEIIRRMPHTIRSLHPRHSMMGIGPLAADFLSNHENCSLADGVGSPWNKLYEKNIVGVFIGLKGLEGVTFSHWIEDIDPLKNPCKNIYESPIQCKIIDDHNVVQVKQFLRRLPYFRQRNLFCFARHLKKDTLRRIDFRGIPITIINFKTLGDDLIRLRDQKHMTPFRFSLKDYIKYKTTHW